MPVRPLALVGLAALTGLAALAGCASSPASLPAVALSGADQGREVTLAVGQRVTVTLDANPTTGYGWALADSVGGALARDGVSVYTQAPAEPGVVGVGGEDVWTFRAVRAGRGRLRLEYGRSFEPDEPPVETFEVPVVVR